MDQLLPEVRCHPYRLAILADQLHLVVREYLAIPADLLIPEFLADRYHLYRLAILFHLAVLAVLVVRLNLVDLANLVHLVNRYHLYRLYHLANLVVRFTLFTLLTAHSYRTNWTDGTNN